MQVTSASSYVSVCPAQSRFLTIVAFALKVAMANWEVNTFEAAETKIQVEVI